MPVFRTEDFALERGGRLAALDVAYERHGALAPARNNAILVTHGITSTHHGAEPPTLDRRRGWWHELIGPGKLFDTQRYCVIASNILGSVYGTTGPASTDPATGRPYGAAFPQITYRDIVEAQHLMLRSLDIGSLVAVAGASIGGFQAFQWAVSQPDFASGIIALDTGPWDTMDIGASLPGLLATLAADPNWNGGDYYSNGGVADALTAARIGTLRSYGIAEKLAAAGHPPDAIEALTRQTAREWAEEFDAHALIRQVQAWADFDLRGGLDRIRAKVLYILCDTDELFPASIGSEVTGTLRGAGVEVAFHQVTSPLGHYATTEEPWKWVPAARRFLAGLGA